MAVQQDGYAHEQFAEYEVKLRIWLYNKWIAEAVVAAMWEPGAGSDPGGLTWL